MEANCALCNVPKSTKISSQRRLGPSWARLEGIPETLLAPPSRSGGSAGRQGTVPSRPGGSAGCPGGSRRGSLGVLTQFSPPRLLSHPVNLFL